MIIDWFRTRKTLVEKAEYFRDKLQIMYDSINSAHSLEELQKNIHQTPEESAKELLILEGSDIGQGVIRCSHWASRLIAMNFYKVLKENPEAINFIEIQFSPVPYMQGEERKTTEALNVTIQYVKGKSPSTIIKELKEEIAGLKEQNEVLSGTVEDLTVDKEELKDLVSRIASYGEDE